MVSLSPERAIELVVLRCPGDVVLRATTDTWNHFRRLIEDLCAGGGEFVFSLRDAGVKGTTPFPRFATLVVRRGQGPLLQTFAETTLLIEGGCDSLLALAENIDCPNPFEGAHFHSDEWTQGVAPGSISIVFDHAANPHAP